MIARWFTPAGAGGRPAYVDRLRAQLTLDEAAQIRTLFERQLTGQPVIWHTYTVFVAARFPQQVH